MTSKVQKGMKVRDRDKEIEIDSFNSNHMAAL